MAKEFKHTITRRLIEKRGCRTKYKILFNDRVLKGYVIRTFSKGVEKWVTKFGEKQVDRYDPEWLMKRNSITAVKVPVDHPTMWGVRAAEAA